MASVFAQASFTVVDAIGVPAAANIPMMIDNTKTLAQAAAAVAAIGDDFAGVTAGKITEARLILFPAVSSDWNTGKPTTASRVEQTGLLNFNNATTRYAFGIDLPALADTFISGGKIVIDTGALADFIALIEAGISGDGVVFVNSAQQALTSLKDALMSFRKHRAANDRRTKVIG